MMNQTLSKLIHAKRPLTIEQLMERTHYTERYVVRELEQAGAQIERLEDGRVKARYFGVKES